MRSRLASLQPLALSLAGALFGGVSLSEALLAQGPPPPPLTPLQPPVAPAGNPITTAKVNLGMALFWEEQMSATKTVSCGTCHIPEAGGSDPRSNPGAATFRHPGADGVFGTPDDVIGSPGVPSTDSTGAYMDEPSFGLDVQVTGRKTPSAIDAGYAPTLFWDGRAGGTLVDPQTNQVVLTNGAALEVQALGPPLSDVEMSHIGRTWTDIIGDLQGAEPLALAESVPPALSAWIDGRGYGTLFQEAFGSQQITASRIAMAIATYERTLVSDQTPLDQELRGIPSLTPLQRQGQAVFAQAGCAVCHPGNRFTDDRFHDLGVRPEAEDLGRFDVTGVPGQRGQFKTPGLRNVSLRAPYMHNGGLQTLTDVVNFYNRGGDFQNPGKAPQMVPLGLSQGQRSALVAFLEALTDPRVATATGPFARPTLYSESARRPQVFGNGTAGSGGAVPRMVALEPPMRGNGQFTVAMDQGVGGNLALLLVDPIANQAGTKVLGIQAHLGLSPDLAVYTAGPLSGTGAGQGWTSISFNLNLPASLVGVSISGQWVVFDAGGPAGVLAASDAVTATLF